MEELIKKFLSTGFCFGFCFGFCDGYGYGFGDGYGYGFGSGFGDGNGYGFGFVFGSSEGDGDGSGYGYGYGDGLKEYNHKKVYMVDNTQTLIDSIHGNYAVGKIVNLDLTTTDCYIAKVGNFFAHGTTLKNAVYYATQKCENNKPIEDIIADFIKAYPTIDTEAEHSDLYRWHNTLTGSCALGRDQFAKDHNLDTEKGTMTVKEFINLTHNAYGSDAIRLLEKAYKEDKK